MTTPARTRTGRVASAAPVLLTIAALLIAAAVIGVFLGVHAGAPAS